MDSKHHPVDATSSTSTKPQAPGHRCCWVSVEAAGVHNERSSSEQRNRLAKEEGESRTLG